MTAQIRTVRRAVCLAVLGVLLLTGCARDVDLAPQAAADLQAGVLEVARAAAQGRYDAAGTAAQEVREALDAAARADEISVARYAEIDGALTRVETEIAAQAQALAAEQAAAEQAAAEEAAELAAAQEAAAEAAAQEAAGPRGSGPAEDGPPKGPGKSKGKGPDKPGPGHGPKARP